jgi:hypothetical protein
MIVLDTNVVSEVLKLSPSAPVLGWLEGQDSAAVFTTTVTLAEILYGVALLPAGRRRTRLAEAVEKIFGEFGGRILEFGSDDARAYAEIMASRERAGLPTSQFDAMIAAMARSHGAAVATRNAADFAGCGIDVINPWEIKPWEIKPGA